MENIRNYYEILGIERNSTPEEIKKAFRRLARQHHPDLNPGDKVAEEKFKEFNEAYRVLSDATTRSQYDQFTRFWRNKKGRNKDFWNNASTRPEHRAKPDDDFSQFGDFNSFIDQLLGRKSRANASERRAERSEDPVRQPGRTSTIEDDRERVPPKYEAPPRSKNVEAELQLPLEKAYQGGRERIKLEDGRSLEVDLAGRDGIRPKNSVARSGHRQRRSIFENSHCSPSTFSLRRARCLLPLAGYAGGGSARGICRSTHFGWIGKNQFTHWCD